MCVLLIPRLGQHWLPVDNNKLFRIMFLKSAGSCSKANWVIIDFLALTILYHKDESQVLAYCLWYFFSIIALPLTKDSTHTFVNYREGEFGVSILSTPGGCKLNHRRW
jgi:hypothetical protein